MDRRRVVRDAKEGAANALLKFRQAQDAYLGASADLYSSAHLAAVTSHFDALSTKFLLAQVHLEELWSLSQAHRLQILELVGAGVPSHSWDDEDLIISMVSFESYLFQARSYLDVFLFYSCLVFGIERPGTMGRKRFRKCMGQVREPFPTGRADQLLAFIEQDVFGPNCWGALLKALRDRVAHRDIIHPGRDGWEEVTGVLLDWPTVQGLTLERLAQSFDNGNFDLLATATELLFHQQWQTGPARSV